MNRLILLGALLWLAAPAVAIAPYLSTADAAAIYRAAGFAMKGGQPVDCAAADPSWPRSRIDIEAIDLDADGKFEAILTEANSACYGRDEMQFTILARNPGGTWRRLARNTGGFALLKTRHKGWLDIEYGGPGMHKPPMLRFDGKIYR